MERDYQKLLKPYWYVQDIQEYLGCSKELATNIKNGVEYAYKSTQLDKGKGKTSVKRDDVIKYIGGTDAVTEAQIYNLIIGGRNGKQDS